MEESVLALDCSETSLKRDFPVILAALRKPAESTYCSGDFKDHLCFIPQCWCTVSEFSSPSTSSPVGGRASSSKTLCKENLLSSEVHDVQPFLSAVEPQVNRTRSKVAEEHSVRWTLQSTADKQPMKASYKENPRPTETVSSTSLFEVSEKKTMEGAHGSCENVVPSPSGAAVQHPEGVTVTPEDKRKMNEDTEAHDISRDPQVGLEDYIPCLFYRWPFSDTLILHFHGLDEDLGNTAVYLERLHQHLKINILAMEYPGYGICSELPRDSDEGSAELFRDPRSENSPRKESSSPCCSGPLASKRHRQAALPPRRLQRWNAQSLQPTEEQHAEQHGISLRSSYDERTYTGSPDEVSLVKEHARLVNTGHATEESFRQTSPSSAADYRRTAASFRRLLLFVLKRLEVSPQCVFLSAVKLAAGLVIELYQFADQLLGEELSFGGLILLQPLFVFPFPPPRKAGRASLTQREQATSPRQPASETEAGKDAGRVHHFACQSTQTQKSMKKLSLLSGRAENIPVKERDIANTRPAGGQRAHQANDQPESLRETRRNENPQANWRAHQNLEELCTTSSLDTTVELLQVDTQEKGICRACAQADSGAAEEKSSSFRRGRDTTVSNSPAQHLTRDMEQSLAHPEPVSISHYHCTTFSNVTGDAESVHPSPRVGGASVATSDPISLGGSRCLAPGATAAAGEGLPVTTAASNCQRNPVASTAVRSSVLLPSQSDAESVVHELADEASSKCNTPASSGAAVELSPFVTQLDSILPACGNLQNPAKRVPSFVLYAEGNDCSHRVTLSDLTSYTLFPLCDAVIHNEQDTSTHLDRAAAVIYATGTGRDEREPVSNSNLFPFSVDKMDSTSLEKLGLDSPSKSFFEHIRGFLLPSLTLVPQDEPEEGGRAAAIAEAALQLGRRKKLERRRRIAATLEESFGMKQRGRRGCAGVHIWAKLVSLSLVTYSVVLHAAPPGCLRVSVNHRSSPVTAMESVVSRIRAGVRTTALPQKALQRVSAVKCPILFIAHCAFQPSRPNRARKTGMCRNPVASSGEDTATDSSCTTLSSSDSDSAAPVSDPDMLGAFSRMLGEGGSLLPGHKAAGMQNGKETESAGSSTLHTSTQATECEEHRATAVRNFGRRARDTQQTAFHVGHCGDQDMQKGKDGNKKLGNEKTVLIGEEACYELEKRLYNGRDELTSFDRRPQGSRFPSRNNFSCLKENDSDTCSTIPKQIGRRCRRRRGEENTGITNDRLAEDIIVERSIGLLMAHANSSARNEVFTTFQLDNNFFSRVKAFVESCRKTERRRQEIEQLAALRVPIELSSKKEVGESSNGRISSSRGRSQKPCSREETATNIISPARRPDFVKSRSRTVRTGSEKTVCVPLEFFVVPPPYRHREEALNRVYAKEKLEDDEDGESLISEQSWLHKTLEAYAKKLNLLAAAERAV